MSQFIIQSELETRVKNWAAAQSPVVQVAYENVPFTKPADKSPFVEVYLSPVVTSNVTVAGNRQRYLGNLYINIWTPDGKGTGQSNRILASLVSAFPVVPKTGSVSIESLPNAKRAIYEDGWRVVPVTIQYRYEA